MTLSTNQALSLAIRMTACRPDLPGAWSCPPIVRANAVSSTSGNVFNLPAGSGAGDALSAQMSAAGQRPTTIDFGELVLTLAEPPGTGRLRGNVVLVTGSARGLGLGLANALAAEGALLVFADLNEAGCREAADALNQRAGSTVAVASALDVADSASIEACMALAVEAFGGLDIVVCNAGVLSAGGLNELEESAFDFVNRVNYKGYFLCARAAAAIMKQQHGFNASHVMDIVQINSKSGLEGSNRNFAYAGSKFGGIGLTQSFALELIDEGIKVNAICPGNYFDGPLWSDPKTGLFAQYLEAGKVAGAKTVEDVKNFYLSKIPMKRGVSPLDIARAIVYLHEQVYETGQALPVTGGQVMLN